MNEVTEEIVQSACAEYRNKCMLDARPWIDSIAMHAALTAILPMLTAQGSVVDRDGEMLDWLDKNYELYGFEDYKEGNRWIIDGPFNTVRDAIDAAMGEKP